MEAGPFCDAQKCRLARRERPAPGKASPPLPEGISLRVLFLLPWPYPVRDVEGHLCNAAVPAWHLCRAPQGATPSTSSSLNAGDLIRLSILSGCSLTPASRQAEQTPLHLQALFRAVRGFGGYSFLRNQIMQVQGGG